MDAENVEKFDIFFLGLFLAAQVIGVLSLLLVSYWCISFAGGFGLSAGLLFQWHPLFATIGMVYLLGNAILMFRIFHSQPKHTLKRIHAAVNIVGLVFTMVAVLVVFLRPHRSGKVYLYSMHGWLGLLAIILYVLQAVVSVAAFLLDAVSNQMKICLIPVHIYLGHAIFILGIGAAVTGVNETAIFKLKMSYSKLGNEAILFNCIGILFTFFGLIVVYLSTNIHNKKLPLLQNSLQLRNTLSIT
ncbi:hypothetical protein V9T40_011166 [Parthenolecanium corni]|uniref:Cytochrome b561 domain-containing protein n=1 Tax=Parthenolecanium corni TaxID=536013 RepID=A0AAN9T5J7_9HEMI